MDNTSNASTSWDGPSLSIVCLDDDADFRQFIAAELDADGHDVRACALPEHLYAACESHLPDIVLLDMKMGLHSGEASNVF